MVLLLRQRLKPFFFLVGGGLLSEQVNSLTLKMLKIILDQAKYRIKFYFHTFVNDSII